MTAGNRPKKLAGATLNYGQKRRVILYWDHQKSQVNKDYTLAALARWVQDKFKLPKTPGKSTLSDLLTKHRNKILNSNTQDHNIKRTRIVTHQPIEDALVLWVLQKEHQKICISQAMIQEKGRLFLREFGLSEDTLQFSDHWVEQFCKRNAFRRFRSHGESGAADLENPDIQARIIEIKRYLSEYPPSDRYNMDETALFYNIPPDSTIARKAVEGNKKDKTRIIIAFTCNADGTDRFEPMFIGHAKRPRSFNKKTGEELGFFYCYNKKAWMTGILFQEYLKRFDRHVCRRVILVIDNAPSHIWENLQLSNAVNGKSNICLPEPRFGFDKYPKSLIWV